MGLRALLVPARGRGGPSAERFGARRRWGPCVLPPLLCRVAGLSGWRCRQGPRAGPGSGRPSRRFDGSAGPCCAAPWSAHKGPPSFVPLRPRKGAVGPGRGPPRSAARPPSPPPRRARRVVLAHSGGAQRRASGALRAAKAAAVPLARGGSPPGLLSRGGAVVSSRGGCPRLAGGAGG